MSVGQVPKTVALIEALMQQSDARNKQQSSGAIKNEAMDILKEEAKSAPKMPSGGGSPYTKDNNFTKSHIDPVTNDYRWGFHGSPEHREIIREQERQALQQRLEREMAEEQIREQRLKNTALAQSMRRHKGGGMGGGENPRRDSWLEKQFARELDWERRRLEMLRESLMSMLSGLGGEGTFDPFTQTTTSGNIFNNAGAAQVVPTTTTVSGGPNVLAQLLPLFIRQGG